MNTEIILYRANLVTNGKFANTASGYGWAYTGNWTQNSGSITKLNTAAGILSQSDILIQGVVYRLKFTISDRTTGTCSVKSLSGGTTHLSATANQQHELEFTAEGTDLLFDCNSAFNGTIHNVEIVPLPDKFNLELTGNESIPFNFNIDDIFKLGQRKTAWSKSIEVPFTHYNNKALGHIYKINGEGLFDPRLKARAVIRANGITIFDGWMSLDRIRKFKDGGGSYVVSVTGPSFDIFSKLSGKTIKDLDFSAYDHEFNIETIKANWGYTSGGGYTGTIGYCTNGSYTPSLAQQSDSYTAPTMTALGSHSHTDGIARVKLTFNADHSFSVGDEITVDCDNNLLSGTHVVCAIPSSASIALHMAYANLTSTTVTVGTATVTKRTWLGKGYWYPLQDNGHYEEILGAGPLAQSVYYTFVEVDSTDDFSNIAKHPITGLVVPEVVGNTFVADDGASAPMANVNPSVWTGNTRVTTYRFPSEGGTLTNKNLTINRWHPMDLITHIFISEIWDKMVELVDYEISCDLTGTQLWKRLVMPMDQKMNIEDNRGSPVPVIHMNDWLPGMKLSDFFTSILNLFNLVIIEDKDVRNKITLVSRNTFYDEGTEKSWELHAGEPLEIDLANTLLPKYYHLKYKDSTDFYNKDYNREIGDISNSEGIANDIDRKYGDYYESSGNQFSDKENKVELTFEPTVMAGNMTDVYENSDKVISVTYDANDDGNGITRKSHYRILIAGFRGTDDAFSLTSMEWSSVEINQMIWPNHNNKIFPYAAHIDNVYDAVPFNDLNFGVLLGQYFPQIYDSTLWAANTIVGKHWSRHLSQILDKNSKYVRGTFRLSISDINELDFRNEVRPENCDFLLRLQKVIDWDINGTGLCRCEFLTRN